ncbi:double-stranded RNA-specific adenosine deaminase-like [Watersipora subatra]|uniref:double-stranded RNA-specific adenosine deaminase-like n=1 Tax=Watersipora subatra TaxID=2589382 RepID=UPI00355AFE8E
MDPSLFTSCKPNEIKPMQPRLPRTSITGSSLAKAGMDKQSIPASMAWQGNGYSPTGVEQPVLNTDRKTMKAFDQKTIDELQARHKAYVLNDNINKLEALGRGQSSGYRTKALPAQTRDSSNKETVTSSSAAVQLQPTPFLASSNQINPSSLDLNVALASLKLEESRNDLDAKDSRATPSPSSSCEGQNAISILHERGQKEGRRPMFQVLSQRGPSHQPTFECRCQYGDVEATVSAASKEKGKREAFRQVLAHLNRAQLDSPKANEFVITSGQKDGDDNKNPISCVMELGNKLGITPDFECTQLSITPVSRFEGYCVFGKQRFGPVEAQNKKLTKTEAFKLAYQQLKDSSRIQGELARETHSIKMRDSPLPLSDTSLGLTTVNTEGVRNLLSQKHPVSSILEYAQARHVSALFDEVDDSGPAHVRSFTYRCIVDGTPYPSATARTKKDAKKHAAELALRVIAGTTTPATDATAPASGATAAVSDVMGSASSYTTAEGGAGSLSSASAMPSFPRTVPQKKSDLIANEVFKKFAEVKVNCPADLGKVILAGFIIENTTQSTFIVVSLGTGNKCLSGKYLSIQGTAVNDCHAEVIAKRGLHRFLYKQLQFHKADKVSIFEDNSLQRLKVKSNLKLHLYISTAPCGDGALFTHNDSNADWSQYSPDDPHSPIMEQANQGQLRSKMEVGEGTIPTSDSPMQTADGIKQGDRLKTMSCSDKICKWNVLGVQGTLLSDLIEPIYITSLVLGQLFNPGYLSRALCCRIGENPLPKSSRFHLEHIRIDRTSETLPRSTAKSKPVSLNWAGYDNHVELLTAETGTIIPLSSDESGSSESRLCKKSLFAMYNQLRNQEPLYYQEAKDKITDYKEVKGILYQRFFDNGLGRWLQKPLETNMFK